MTCYEHVKITSIVAPGSTTFDDLTRFVLACVLDMELSNRRGVAVLVAMARRWVGVLFIKG